jgi:hypothetical protein
LRGAELACILGVASGALRAFDVAGSNSWLAFLVDAGTEVILGGLFFEVRSVHGVLQSWRTSSALVEESLGDEEILRIEMRLREGVVVLGGEWLVELCFVDVADGEQRVAVKNGVALLIVVEA